MALVLLLFGLGLGVRFAYPDVSGHVQSLQVGVGAVVLGFVVGLMALLGDLLAANRRLSEDLLVRVHRPRGRAAGAWIGDRRRALDRRRELV